MFSKLNAYIQILFAMGAIPWKKYNDIPADAIYNMDEVGNDTTKHRNKILTKKTASGTKEVNSTRTFMRTSEGDGRMPWHITICLTTRADGMFWIVVCVSSIVFDCCVFCGGGSESIFLIQSNPVDCRLV